MFGATTKPFGVVQNHIVGLEHYLEASHWVLHVLLLQLHMKSITEFISTMDMMHTVNTVVDTINVAVSATSEYNCLWKKKTKRRKKKNTNTQIVI